MRAADPDNNTGSGASPSSTPPLHAEVREKVEALILSSDPTAKLKIGELTLTDEILQAVADALLAGLPKKFNPELSESAEEYFGKEWYNQAIDDVTRVIGELRGSNPIGEKNGDVFIP